MSTKVRYILVLLAAAAVLVPTSAVADAKRSAKARAEAQRQARAAQECADADLEASSRNLGRIRDAILCLHNKVRAQHRLPPLRENDRLRRAALGHSRDMVDKGYFAHTTPRGVTMVERILRARYVRRDQGWTLGENLAWGTGALGTPQGAVDAWMRSPGHRANILKRAYKELGVGVVTGVPVAGGTGATYTVDFGVRR